jgi:hypothetical protein
MENKVQKVAEDQGIHDNRSLQLLIEADEKITALDSQYESEQRVLFEKYLNLKYEKMEERNTMVQNIPDFWSIALLNHPLLQSVMETKDMEAFRFLTELVVHRNADKREIIFKFSDNPFFENSSISKEVINDGSFSSTEIKWKSGHNLVEPEQSTGQSASFFSWFADEDTEVTDLITNDFYPNATKYYLEEILINNQEYSDDQQASDDDQEETDDDDEEEYESDDGEASEVQEISSDQQSEDEDDDE